MHTQVLVQFDLEPDDTRRFLSVQDGRHRFVFQRRNGDHTLTYVWLDGEVFQAMNGTPPEAWRAEIKRRLGAVAIDRGSAPAPFPFLGGAIGFFSYDALCLARSISPTRVQTNGRYPAVLAAFTRVFAVLDHHAGRGSLVALAAPGADEEAVGVDLAARLMAIRAASIQLAAPDGGEDWCVDIDRAGYEARVRETQRLIATGALEQMILSIGLDRQAAFDPVTAFQRLTRDNPSPHGFLIGANAFHLAGTSPLLHLSISGSQATIETDAGTRPAGDNEAESRHFAQELLTSVKDDVEQKIIAHATMLDLKAITTPGSIHVVTDREVRRFSHTMHLYTVMQGRLRPAVSALDAMLACAPAVALVGAPKRAAMTAIERIERAERGPYGGLVALLGHDGSLDSTVVLRSLWSDGPRTQTRSGGGITRASDPGEEYEEAMQKARTVLPAKRPRTGRGPA